MPQDIRKEEELEWDGNEYQSGQVRRIRYEKRDEIRYEPNKPNRRKDDGRRHGDLNIWKKRS